MAKRPQQRSIPTDQLVMLSRNPQYLTPTQMEALKESIRRDGFLAPILVRRRGRQYEIVSGNHRYMAAVELGVTEIPCVVATLSAAQAKRVAVNLNTVHGDPPAELLAPFLAELDEKDLANIYLDATTIEAVIGIDEDLEKTLGRLQTPDVADRKSPSHAMDRCVCPKCGRSHVKRDDQS